MKILAETGRVDWNKRDEWRQTPLYLALRLGHSDIVDIIVQQPNIDYNVKTRDGETLGHAAVLGGDVKCVETLTAQERFNNWGNTADRHRNIPITMALKKLNMKETIFKLLLKCPRVDVNVEEENGDNLYNIATKTGRSDIIELFEKRNKSNKARDVVMENEELENKIKRKEMDISQLKSRSEKYVAVMNKELETIETELQDSVETKNEAEDEIRRLQKVIESFDENIKRLEQEKKTRESLIEVNLSNFQAKKNDLTEEIENLQIRLDSCRRAVGDLEREGFNTNSDKPRLSLTTSTDEETPRNISKMKKPPRENEKKAPMSIWTIWRSFSWRRTSGGSSLGTWWSPR